MPLYEFECTECGQIREKYYPVDDCPIAIMCEGCHCVTARKIISAPADRRAWDPYWEENMGPEPILVESREHREKLKKKLNLEDSDVDATKLRVKRDELKDKHHMLKKRKKLNKERKLDERRTV